MRRPGSVEAEAGAPILRHRGGHLINHHIVGSYDVPAEEHPPGFRFLEMVLDVMTQSLHDSRSQMEETAIPAYIGKRRLRKRASGQTLPLAISPHARQLAVG
jgi:hypothetical protein